MVDSKKIVRDIKDVIVKYTRKLEVEQSERIVKSLLKRIEDIISGISISFLYYDAWQDCYRTIDVQDKSPSFNIQSFIKNRIDNKTFKMIKPSLELMIDHKTYMVKYNISPYEKPFYLVIDHKEKAINPSVLVTFSEEFEFFLKGYINKIDLNKKMKYSSILNQLSKEIYARSNRQSVLTYFIKYFEKVYPFLKYEIFLSQDYDIICDLPVRELKFDYNGNRLIDQAFLKGKAVSFHDDHRVGIYVPLKGNQGVYGVFAVSSESIKKIPKSEVNMILEFGSIGGQALENVSLYQHSVNLVNDLKLINDAIKELNSNSNTNKLTSIVIKYIKKASLAEEIGILLFDKNSTKKYKISNGSSSFFKNGQEELLANLVKRSLNNSRIFTGNLSNLIDDAPFESVIALPMIHSGQYIGLIFIMHSDKYFFSYDTFKFIQSLTQHYTLIISNAILKNKLEEAVIRDYLTNLYSRNYLDESTKQHMQSGEQGVLILFDIDDFKDVNDTYGHYVGDQVIIQVAKVLQNKISEDDIAARWGGEELALYLPNRSIAEAYLLAKDILSTVERITSPKVTLSCGISSWESDQNDSVKELFISTDQALYEAKSSGKNQIIISYESKKDKSIK